MSFVCIILALRRALGTVRAAVVGVTRRLPDEPIGSSHSSTGHVLHRWQNRLRRMVVVASSWPVMVMRHDLRATLHSATARCAPAAPAAAPLAHQQSATL